MAIRHPVLGVDLHQQFQVPPFLSYNEKFSICSPSRRRTLESGLRCAWRRTDEPLIDVVTLSGLQVRGGFAHPVRHALGHRPRALPTSGGVPEDQGTPRPQLSSTKNERACTEYISSDAGRAEFLGLARNSLRSLNGKLKHTQRESASFPS